MADIPEPGDQLRIDGHVTKSMIVHGHEVDAGGAPCIFFMLQAQLDHGGELTIGLCKDATMARDIRADLDRYINAVDQAADAELKNFLGDQQ